MTATRELVTDQRQEFAFHDDIVYLQQTKRGLTRETVDADTPARLATSLTVEASLPDECVDFMSTCAVPFTLRSAMRSR